VYNQHIFSILFRVPDPGFQLFVFGIEMTPNMLAWDVLG
jgi:hypothetical protein